MTESVPKLVPTRPEAEVAADIKRRFEEACLPIAALMDEAAASGLQVQWDGFSVGPPNMRFHLIGLKLVKFY